MTRLEVTDADVARERAQVLESLALNRDAPMMAAMSYAAEAVQPSRGGAGRGGVAAEIETIDAAAIAAAWQAHYKPANARLIVTGRFDPTPVRAQIEAAFATVPAGTPPVLRPPADTTVTGTLVMGDAPSAIAIAVPAPARTSPLYPAFLILAARLPSGPYDALTTPETLFVTALVAPGEPAEPAAARLRAETLAIVGRPLAPSDVDAARKQFARLLGTVDSRSARGTRASTRSRGSGGRSSASTARSPPGSPRSRRRSSTRPPCSSMRSTRRR